MKRIHSRHRRWYEGLMKRIERRQATVSAFPGMDLKMFGYVRIGKRKKDSIMIGWEEGTHSRERRREYYHNKHPDAKYYYKK